MKNISDIDFRDLKPSMARWLGSLIEDASSHEAVVGKLKSYLDRLDVEQPSDKDQATALSHELASIGVWNAIDEQLFVKGLASISAKKIKVMFSAAPLALEEHLLKSITTSRRVKKRRHTAAIAARTKKRKLIHGQTARFFTAIFESKRVAASLRLSGVSLSSEEKTALCKILDKKSRMYVEGCVWQVSVTQKLDTNDFSVGELTVAQHGLGVVVGPRITGKTFAGSKTGIVAGTVFAPQTRKAPALGFGSFKRTKD